jgi:predicted O-methyltransferase YrrM
VSQESALRSPQLAAVLARLAAAGAAEDAPAKARVRAREAEAGAKVYGAERARLYGTAPIAVAPDVGRLLYVLATARPAPVVVEFGASLGVSTIHLAAAVRDAGAGRVITSELSPEKARLARENLRAAGLEDVVELRVGDARETLRELPDAVDLLFLDGWNDLYRPVLELVQPRLGRGAVVVADLSAGDPECAAYRAHVHARDDYVSVDVPLDEGVVVSLRTTGPRGS